MALFTVFVRDCVVLVHDLKAMVLFTVFIGDRVVLVHDLKTMVSFMVFEPWFLDYELEQHDLQLTP
jgi:hypothetical protein